MSEEQSKKEILEQVEFYFSDSNLPKDRFLYTTAQANEGWVSISVLANFTRMRKFRPIELIVEALRESEKLLEVSENGEMVRRKVPLPSREEQIKIAQRSVVVEDVPEDATLEQLQEFFKKYGKTNQVRMKRNRKTKEFFGKVIVEFSSVEEQKAFLEAETKPTFNEKELKITSKVAYDESRESKRTAGFNGRDKSKGKKRGNQDDDESNKRVKDDKEVETEKEAVDDAEKEAEKGTATEPEKTEDPEENKEESK
ncbi:BA75_02675T0 [Komagataella pastoris]|uniref:BA75_02675T0 n=1 Tax=Komagataella pastoris TaxID=4922 RepID=A0A1B2JB65_PICPA|nr:BA75_02675T0 [Komagataella pastoris]